MTKFTAFLLPTLLGSTLLFAGCATSPTRPIIDAAPSAQLDADMAECASLAATHVANDAPVRNGAVSSALVGAAAGGIEDAWDGAIVGALLGGCSAAFKARPNKATPPVSNATASSALAYLAVATVLSVKCSLYK